MTGTGWRPRGWSGWALALLAWLLVVPTATMAFYMLDPIDYDGIGRLGWVGFLFPLQLLSATVAAAALATLAWRRRIPVATTGFVLIAAVTAGLALWPSIAVWRRAERYHVALSIGDALELQLDSDRPARERSVVYATASDGARLMLDVWPGNGTSTGAPRPAVVRVHGGA